MSFDATERGRFSGKPVHLFTFTRQGLSWRYCTGTRPYTYGAFTWQPAQIRRSAIQEAFDQAKDDLTITMAYLRNPVAAAAEDAPVTQAVGDNWFPYMPHDPIYVTCMAAHVGSEDAPAVEWIGITSVPVFTDTELQIKCAPARILGRAREQGPKWQRGCWKQVYSTGLRGCNLDPESFRVAAELTDVSGLTLTAAAFSTSELSLAGGWIQWERDDGLIEKRSIVAHEDDEITLLYGAPGLEVGLELDAYPPCQQTWEACEVRGNTINYGGAIYKPIEDPMQESMSWG